MNQASLRAALRLMVILDPSAAGSRKLADIASQAAAAGATMLQLRAKHQDSATLAALAREILSAARGVPVIVNDRMDIALATGAAGCHLGPDDMPLRAARAMAPAGFVLGASAGTPAEAADAQREGADYLGVGPINATSSKHDAGSAIGVPGFERIRQASSLPAVAIGGIGEQDVAPLMAAGAAGVAVIRAVAEARDIHSAVEALKR